MPFIKANIQTFLATLKKVWETVERLTDLVMFAAENVKILEKIRSTGQFRCGAGFDVHYHGDCERVENK